jgi:hypothetical protein
MTTIVSHEEIERVQGVFARMYAKSDKVEISIPASEVFSLVTALSDAHDAAVARGHASSAGAALALKDVIYRQALLIEARQAGVAP